MVNAPNKQTNNCDPSQHVQPGHHLFHLLYSAGLVVAAATSVLVNGLDVLFLITRKDGSEGRGWCTPLPG